MPEALACFFVISFSLAFIGYARVQGAAAARREPEVELRRAEQHIAWLGERLGRARRERWDARMIASLETQLAREQAGRDQVAALAASRAAPTAAP
jgi:hypothetical protein